MVGDTAGERSIVRELGRAWIMFHGASDDLASDVGMKRAGRGRMAAPCLALLLHAGAALLMVTTEISLAGVAVFLLVWVMLNCLWLALLRKPTVAALISLGILIVLTLLSRFKFDKLWMTIDFVDVMIIDRDTTAFLLEIFPGLRWGILLAVAATAVAIVIAWRLDRYRVSLQTSLVGFSISAATLVAVSLFWPTGLNEDFESRSYVSKFARTGVEAVHELSLPRLSRRGESARGTWPRLPTPSAVQTRKLHISFCCNDESSFDITRRLGSMCRLVSSPVFSRLMGGSASSRGRRRRTKLVHRI
jgi:hypothetical protein